MKKYLLSGTKFQGEVEVVYSGEILSVDFSRTDMPAPMRNWVLNTIPAHESKFPMFADQFPQLQVISANVEVEFENWWKLYDEKLNKQRVLGLWGKLTQSERVAAWLGTHKYNRFLEKNKWRNKLGADTFLRTKAWTNEYK
jgi:hypothetical protein